MKAKEVMDLLDISRRTLSRYITKGIIKGKRLPTGRYIYDDESVYKLADNKKIKGNQMPKGRYYDEESVLKLADNYIIIIVNNKEGEK